MTSPTQRGKPRRRLSADERRTAILESAEAVFARTGYHGSSIDDIASEAGISKALIYEHFPSKKDLHASLLEASMAELFERIAREAATDEPGDVRLRAGIEAFLAGSRIAAARSGWCSATPSTPRWPSSCAASSSR